ncbi:uroporphyrinogen-III C-methyltransferase [Kangiella aquimarina]|uniref:Uroporphyrinogen-III C-methyltransferase n=1 Tax=Kangiella aquimarina TaxID=261965 RepID=A0ABZ0X587_9GAMM|nr:uroporphyrinogen-III C-methyltransferase [Kangiella aquimarina]WQG85524.1 uroporphyrinogen-III C-methyltransferase [Kangiella aquimarina]
MSKKDKDAKDMVKQESSPASQDDNQATSSTDSKADSKTKSEQKEPAKKVTGSGPGKKTPPSNTTSPKNSSPFKWVIIVIILAIIGAGSYYGWTLWNNYQTAQDKASTLDRLNQQVQQQQNVIDSLESDSKQQANELSQVNHQLSLQLEQLQKELKETQQKITSTDEQQNQWMLSEAEYLIRQASYKLHYTDNAKTIVGLLQAADRQVLAMNDSSLQNLRQAISNDINAVRASGALDIEGVTIKLQSLKSLVADLELATVQLPDSQTNQESNEAETTSEEDISGWQRFKDSFSSALSQYYTVHHYDESMKPFISPQHDALLRQNILLNLQTAQLAAIQHNDAMYHNALSVVEDWVSQYFKSEPATTTAFMQQLDELVQMNVALNLPQQLESLPVIERVTGRQSQTAPVQQSQQEAVKEEPATSEEVAQ